MKTYLFHTVTTMKEYNQKKWWIDSHIVNDLHIEADNVNEALKQYQEIVKDKFYIEISNNALKCKNPMYIDTTDGTIQTGYVITGKTEFEDRDNYKWSAQYIDLWVNINIIENAFQKGA